MNVILRAFYNVYNELAYGFLERVYQNAMASELSRLGVQVTRQMPLSVYFSGESSVSTWRIWWSRTVF